MVSKSPVRLHGLPPVVEAEHDGEGAGGQQLLVVVVEQAVSCCQGKSVANLFDNDGHPTDQKVCCIALVGGALTKTLPHLLLMKSASMSSSRRRAAIQG